MDDQPKGGLHKGEGLSTLGSLDHPRISGWFGNSVVPNHNKEHGRGAARNYQVIGITSVSRFFNSICQLPVNHFIIIT